MGLSSFTATVKRRLSSHSSSAGRADKTPKPSKPCKPSKPSKPSKASKPVKSSRQTPRRARIKDLSPHDLLHMLGTMRTVPSADTAAALADRITSNPTILHDLVDNLVHPTYIAPSPAAHEVPARTRLHTAWVISTLIRLGPPQVLIALAAQPPLVRSLASVFDAKLRTLDPAHATLVAHVLRTLLHHAPRHAATALHNTNLLPALARHIAVQPAADLLPRFVGERAFSSLPPAPLIPAHKRAVAAMGAAQIHNLLADRFVHAAADILDASSSDGMEASHSRQVLRLSASTMAEISVRAAYLATKYEDADERADAMYAGSLGLVTSAVFNDAKRHMDFLLNPEPAVSVLRLALTDGATEVDIIVPALAMVTDVLRNAHLMAKHPQRVAADPIDTSQLVAALMQLTPLLIDVLRAQDDANKVGRIRLAAVDYVRAIAEGGGEEGVFGSLCEHECGVVSALLDVASRFPRNNVLQVGVAKIVEMAFCRFDAVARAVLSGTEVAGMVLELWEDATMERAVESIVDWTRSDKVKMSWFGDELKERVDMLAGLMAQVKEKKKNREADLWATLDTRGMGLPVKKASFDLLAKSGLDRQISEDFGQELYVMNLLEEVSGLGNTAPPTEDFVADAENAEGRHWSKGLPSKVSSLMR